MINKNKVRFALTLTRSYDQKPDDKKESLIHLLYSAYKFPSGEDFNSKIFSLKSADYMHVLKESGDEKKNLQIINMAYIIYRFKAFDFNIEDKNQSLGQNFMDNIINNDQNISTKMYPGAALEINIPLISLLTEKHMFGIKNGDLLQTIFGHKNNQRKNFNEMMPYSIFIFEGFSSLKTIIDLFKSFDIYLSGGGIPSRGSLSTIHSNLHSYLILSGNLRQIQNRYIKAIKK